MKKIEWNENLELGIEFLDKEHRELLNLFNQISIKNRVYEEDLLTLLIHSKYYLADEETLLLDISYPNYMIHKEKHNYFIRELENIIGEKITQKTDYNGDIKLKELFDWFINHIKEEDKNISPYFFNP